MEKEHKLYPNLSTRDDFVVKPEPQWPPQDAVTLDPDVVDRVVFRKKVRVNNHD